MADSSVRTIFTNEMGIKFFDFEYSVNGFKVVSVIKQLNKKVVINRLKKDIGLLILHNVPAESANVSVSGNEIYHTFLNKNEHIYYITTASCTQLVRIETGSNEKKKIVVNLSGMGSGMADSVYLAHQSFEYNITLKKIIR